METQYNIPTKTEASTIVVTFTPKGIESPVIHSDSEEMQLQLEGLLSRIAPCLDIASAIIKRGSSEVGKHD